METEQFECTCRSDSHTLRFKYDPEEHEIYVHARLECPRTWSWLYAGVSSVLGLKPRPGQLECFILQPQDAERLRALLDRLIQNAAQATPGSTGRGHVR